MSVVSEDLGDEGEQAAVPLLEPREGIPTVTVTDPGLRAVVQRIAAGTGPVAVDAERASGYRYGQRAYLVQIRREGAGTALIDPIACPDLSGLTAAIGDAEVLLHAANQDLPCLREVGFAPRKLFDTELAGRLLGFPKVGLGAMVERLLGYTLEKGFSAADWSRRPLPEDWLRYAALDVELLVELRNVLVTMLTEADKLEWATEEFEAVLQAPPREPRADPWRRTSGIHRVRSRRGLAIVRELWRTRDRVAERRDIAPGRVLADAAIVAAAVAEPKTSAELAALREFSGRGTRRNVSTWYGAVNKAIRMPDRTLPDQSAHGDGPPPAHRWAERDPAAAARLTAAKAVVATLADEHSMPAENLLQPDAVRRLSWSPPEPATEDSIAAALAGQGARHWQIGLSAGPLAKAFIRLETKT